MKRPPQNPEFARFTAAVRQIVTVSKTDLQQRIAAKKKGKRVRTSTASPVPAVSFRRVN
jgi:hypothetical protein